MIVSIAIEPYRIRGYHIYEVPTGEVYAPGTRSEFKVVDIWACPPGMTPPVPVLLPEEKPEAETPPAPEEPAKTKVADDLTGLAVTGGVIAAAAAAMALT